MDRNLDRSTIRPVPTTHREWQASDYLYQAATIAAALLLLLTAAAV
jgi:hypothetical protein